MWIESLCNDDKLIETNIKITKLSSPDYRDVDSDLVKIISSARLLIDFKATKDFLARIDQYRKIYEEVSKEDDGEVTLLCKIC